MGKKKRRDHFVQAAYLGAWSVTSNRDRHGKIYFFDKENPERGWRKTGVETAAAKKGLDLLSREEAKHLGVKIDALESAFIGPIESSPITQLSLASPASGLPAVVSTMPEPNSLSVRS